MRLEIEELDYKHIILTKNILKNLMIFIMQLWKMKWK